MDNAIITSNTKQLVIVRKASYMVSLIDFWERKFKFSCLSIPNIALAIPTSSCKDLIVIATDHISNTFSMNTLESILNCELRHTILSYFSFTYLNVQIAWLAANTNCIPISFTIKQSLSNLRFQIPDFNLISRICYHEEFFIASNIAFLNFFNWKVKPYSIIIFFKNNKALLRVIFTFAHQKLRIKWYLDSLKREISLNLAKLCP